MTEPTLAARASAARAELARWREDFEGALAAQFPAAEIPSLWAAIGARFDELLEKMPDPGWRAPTMRAFSTSGAIYVAVRLVLASRGLDAARTWTVCEAATRAHFAKMKGMERSAASSGMFSWPMRWLVRSLQARSREAPVGGWAASYVAGDGAFDFGVDYTRCAIRELAVSAGAADFAPYICLADIAGSEEFGWGLVRTETIAQGGSRCDFRFKRGGETKVRVRLPVSG